MRRENNIYICAYYSICGNRFIGCLFLKYEFKANKKQNTNFI